MTQPLRDLLLVGGGGFVGSVARYYLGGLVLHAAGAPRFPLATLGVNTLGCLTIGVLSALGERHHVLTPGARLLLFTGVLGGFTTFSAFAYETYFLAREEAWGMAALGVGLQIVLGLGAVWAGHRAVELLLS